MSSDFIVPVTDTNFEYDVIAYSQNTPVVVDFWADWCKPCKVLTPIFEKIVMESQGAFRLAQVDVDANPNLTLRFSVRTIPTVIAFSQGTKVSDFSGLMPEPRVREFISRILPPHPSNLLAQKGTSLLAKSNIEGAKEAFLKALEIDGAHPGGLLGLMKINLLQGNSKTAFEIYQSFPASLEFNEAEKMIPLIKAMENFYDHKLPVENDLDAAFSNCIRLATRGNVYACIDGLLDILRQDRKYRKEKARNVLLGLFELLDPEGEQTRKYRSELATILF